MYRFLILCLTLINFNLGIAQDKTSHLFLFDVADSNPEQVLFTNPRLLTAFNAKGYNNQPFFINDHQLIFSSSQTLNPLQTDVILLDVRRGTKRFLTQTPQSEFSPCLMPEQNYLSTVLIEADDSTQRLWKYPFLHKTKIQPLFLDLKNVGYQHWISENEIVLFIVGDPNTLLLVNLQDKSIKELASNVGRCFMTNGKKKIAYVDKNNAVFWQLSELDLNTLKSKSIIATLPDVEDFGRMDNGTFFMAKGSKIYKMNPKWDKNWKLQADFGFYDINHISRIVFGPNNQVVIVN